MIGEARGPCACGVVDDVCRCATLHELAPGDMVTGFVDVDAPERPLIRDPDVRPWALVAVCNALARTVNAWLLNLPR